MRTRDIRAALKREISNSRSRQDKLTLIDIITRMEKAELELRRLRLLARHVLGAGEKRITSGGFRDIHAAHEEKLSSRLQSLIYGANAPDTQSVTQEGKR